MYNIRVKVPAAAAADYDVLLAPELLQQTPELLRERVPAARYALIADRIVAGLYGDDLLARLQAAGLDVQLFEHEPGERAKTRASWAALTDALLAAGFGRDSCVLALGGGVTGDLAGFVAATYMRGLPVVQLPTTLLAMVDASVGGKTAVDCEHGKNLIGAFHPPRLVFIDPVVLRTLPAEELISGAAEVIKHGAIMDAAYLEQVRRNAAQLLAADAELLTRIVGRSIEIKAEVVGRDPLEQNERAVLNFGHTLGHALERVTDYRTPHGYAVAIGMMLATRAGEQLGVTEPGSADVLRDALAALGLPWSLPGNVAWQQLLPAARTDKKARAGHLRLVLLERPGRVARCAGEWTHPIGESALSRVLTEV